MVIAAIPPVHIQAEDTQFRFIQRHIHPMELSPWRAVPVAMPIGFGVTIYQCSDIRSLYSIRKRTAQLPRVRDKGCHVLALSLQCSRYKPKEKNQQ